MNVNYGEKCKVDSDCPQMYAKQYMTKIKTPRGDFV